MAVCFAIQVFGYGEDFLYGRPASIVMWNENLGPVSVSYPISGPVSFTVYQWGSTVMEMSANIGGANRIVSLSTQTILPNQNNQGGGRASPISFDIRQPGSGGGSGVFYNYSSGIFEEIAFSNASGTNGAITKPTASNAKDQANLLPSTKYDLFQQLYRLR